MVFLLKRDVYFQEIILEFFSECDNFFYVYRMQYYILFTYGLHVVSLCLHSINVKILNCILMYTKKKRINSTESGTSSAYLYFQIQFTSFLSSRFSITIYLLYWSNNKGPARDELLLYEKKISKRKLCL